MIRVLRRIAMLAVLAVLAAAPAEAANGGFLAEIDDLPLPPGFAEEAGGTLFDAPQGRIVEANAQGRMLEVEARTFYDESLPPLGWTRVGPSEYRRDKEALRLDYAMSGMTLKIHYSLAPTDAGVGGDAKGGGK